MTELRSAVWWRDDHLEVIDQTLLPDVVEIRNLTTAADVIDAIRTLAVRGAPAIGVCGAFGVAMGLREGRVLDDLVESVGTARPTGVNLARAVERVARAARKGTSPDVQHGLALDEALRIADEDRESCRRIGDFGRAELASAKRLLTHCNTGRLATAGIGTALGIVYAKAEAGEEVDVLVTESRPVLQGARLTTWELADAGIPVTLISDPAAGAAIATGRVDAVVVGCDRVARNGDFANKIGTYALAVLARESRVPFYVAGPLTSFDADIRDGEHIVVEERDGDEVRRLGDARIAPEVAVWNPAFDVTAGRLVTAFITDAGVLRPPYEESIARALDDASLTRS